MPRRVPAVERALDILELFLRSPQPESLSVPEIARALDLPRSTAHELVATLVARRYLRPIEGNPHRYALDVRVFELGNAYAAGLDLAREGQIVARRVAASCDETVHIAVLEGTDVFYIAKVDSTNALRLVSAIGRRLPAHCTAVGKMLLSGLSEEEFAERFAGVRELPGMTRNSLRSVDALRAELARTRARGIAWDNCESNPDVRCVAAPIYDHRGRMVAAMSISFPVVRDTPERFLELSRLVWEGARELSQRLGYREISQGTWQPELPPWHSALVADS
ncbi:IclR family transcriptional regulator [Thermomicrobium sp. CFH 73360]|uniref:IclR family transcriptional regulator n=1 Tax=Thermomicrobium sp. CFH 73360 TaxID=2951987 RepID=UPI002076F4E5|nr:IclR family transcriptional regulator [Thermomicrobium sp. CFH 73360]MCM8746850.1 IclR family transcriptional regulator [Thermomicrobium sp. CFH 73360]